MQNKAKTVDAYLDELTEERRNAISKIREIILENLPLDIIGKAVAYTSVDDFIKMYNHAKKLT
ncbi:MAG: hypothetical protein ACTSVO_13450 [Candidatus Heimdallarchaeaceae archaeon]